MTRKQLIDAVAELLLVAEEPLAELRHAKLGSFAYQVEECLLERLYGRHGSWRAVAKALDGRPMGAGLQRTIDRHPQLKASTQKK